MRSALNSVKEDRVGPLATEFLLKLGHRPSHIAGWKSKTRLFQDLHWLGDSAIEYFETLASRHHVDLSSFPFDEFFPSELSHDSFITTNQWVLRKIGVGFLVDRVYGKYREITFAMIENAIREGKLVA